MNNESINQNTTDSQNVDNTTVQNNNIQNTETTVDQNADNTANQNVDGIETTNTFQNNNATSSNPKIQDIVIYTVKPEKQGNPLILLLFFIILVFLIIFLPKIENKFGNQNNPINNSNNTETPTTNNRHKFNEAIESIDIDNLNFSNVMLSKTNNSYEISFTLINNRTNAFDYEGKYYIVLFRNDKIIHYALVQTLNKLDSKAAIELSIPIPANIYKQAESYEIRKIIETEYTSAKIKTQEKDYDILTCNFSNHEIKYYFLNKLLNKIEESYKYTNNIENFETQKEKIYKTNAKYKEIEGIESNYIETKEEIELINKYSLSDITDKDLQKLKKLELFRYNQKLDVVNFESIARGYSCQ